MSRQPTRLADFPYVGMQRYFLTIATARRAHLLTRAAVVEPALSQIRRSATAHAFALIAWCFMPDHLHLVVEASSDDADCRAFAKLLKQLTGFQYRRLGEGCLWQRGYVDRVLRSDESTEDVVRYVLGNPVRAGLVRSICDWPFSGSDTFDIREL